MVTDHKQLQQNLPADKNTFDRWDLTKFSVCFSSILKLSQTQSTGIVPNLSSDKHKKVEVAPFSLFSLNINMTVDSIMSDHGMEKDSQCRSESRADASAASCSQAEKRPLNNNILINAPLPCSVATGSNR